MTQPTVAFAEGRKGVTRKGDQAREAMISLARVDPSAFCAYVLKDEKTGGPIKLSGYHEQWHRDLSENQNLILWASVESGKTNQITIGRLLYELGSDTTLRNAIISATAGQSLKILKSIARYIEFSEELHDVFPGLIKGEPWSPDSGQIYVQRPSTRFAKDPSIQALGLHGAILGARIDRLWLDDVLRHENVRTDLRRDETVDWYGSTLSGRLSDDARVRWVGQAWHPKDAMHQLERMGWPAKRYPLIDAKGEATWPERWPLERIARWKAQNPSTVEYMRQLLCVARDDAESRFRVEWVEACKSRAEGLSTIDSLQEGMTDEELAADTGMRLSDGDGETSIFTGVDLAVQKHDAADKTVFFTAMLHPNGDRQILNIESGRWGAMEIVRRAASIYKRFGSMFIVENNGAQQYIVDLMRDLNTTIPVRPFTTGLNKAHIEFGVESLGAELESARWLIPNERGQCDPEVEAWVQGLLTYQPDAHTSDHVMAGWLCREGMRHLERRRSSAGGVGFRSI